MSWLFSQALVAAFSEASSLDGEPFAQLNVMPTAHPFWRGDKPMDASRLSRFGLTSQVLTVGRGEELLTSFLADFRARTSASQERETDLTASAADSGAKWRGSFARFDHDTSTWRTAQCSLLEDSVEFSENWPRNGSMRNGECYQRPALEPITSANESGLLPTPVAVDTGAYFNRSVSAGAALRPTLGAMAKYDLWPTPNNRMTWPTPAARDYRFPNRLSYEERGGGTKGEQLPNAVGGPLNPAWVEWLMGWPIGWTELKPLEMGRFREWLQQHGGDC